MEKVVSEAEELPKAIVRRVVKDKLSDCYPDYDIDIHKDALQAFAESAHIFNPLHFRHVSPKKPFFNLCVVDN